MFDLLTELRQYLLDQGYRDVYINNTPERSKVPEYIALLEYEDANPFDGAPRDLGQEGHRLQIVVQRKDDLEARQTCNTLRNLFIQDLDEEFIQLSSCPVMGYVRGTPYRATWTEQFQYRCNVRVVIPSYVNR